MTILGEIADLSSGIGFGISGGGPSLEVVDELQRAGGAFHTTRFEGSAALMAGVVGRLTGRLGIALSIKGPGLANLSAGLATATLEDLPLLAVTEAYGRADGPAKAHKRLDQDGLLSAVVKARLGTGDKDVVSRLVSIATAERPGPVVLELADTDGRIAPVPQATRRDDEAAIRAIANAKRPVVVAGSLALRKGWSDFLNRLSVPTFSTASVKGVVDETLPHAAGPYTGVGRGVAPECELLKDADLLVGIGLRSHEVLSASGKIACVNFDDLDLAPGFSFEATGSASAAPRALELIGGKTPWGGHRIAEARMRMRRELLSGPFLPAQAYACLAETLPSARMVLDTGYFCTIGEHMWDVCAPDLYLSSAQGRSMGAALPMAIAAALCRRDELTILAIGDGGIGMYVAELMLAVSERLPLLVVFMRDGTHASVRERAVSKGLDQTALIAKTPDWAQVASALGLKAGCVEKPEDLVSFVGKWNRAGPAFVQVDFAPEPYLTMTSNLRS